MARHNVVTTPMMEYTRKSPSGPFLGWGNRAIRKTDTKATSARLLKYRSCIAGKMSGKSFADLKSVQEAFRAAAHECKASL